MKINCKNCGIELSRKPSYIAKNKNICCSTKCMGELNSNKIKVKCAECNTDILKTPSEIKRSKTGKVFCSHSCSAKHSNPNRFGTGHSSYKKQVFAIKEHKCERCGYNEVIEILQVHHVDRNRRNHHIDNLEILCPNCHFHEHYLAKDGMYSSIKNIVP